MGEPTPDMRGILTAVLVTKIACSLDALTKEMQGQQDRVFDVFKGESGADYDRLKATAEAAVDLLETLRIRLRDARNRAADALHRARAATFGADGGRVDRQ